MRKLASHIIVAAIGFCLVASGVLKMPGANAAIQIIAPRGFPIATASLAASPTWGAKSLGPVYTSGTSYTITAPASVGLDDIIVVVLFLDAAKTITAPSGFALKASKTYAGGDNFNTYVYWKREDASPDASYAFSWTGATGRCGTAHRLDGAINTGDPFDTHVSSGVSGPDSNNYKGGTITTSVGNTLGILIHTGYEFSTASSPSSGWTERQDSGETSGGVDIPIFVGTRDFATAGTYKVPDGSYTGTAGPTSTFILALRSNAAGTSTPATTVPSLLDFDMSTAAGTTLTTTILSDAQGGDTRISITLNGGSLNGMTIEDTIFSSVYVPTFASGGRLWTPGAKMMQHNHATTTDNSRLDVQWVGGHSGYTTYTDGTTYLLAQFDNASPSGDINIDHMIIQDGGGNYAVMQQTMNNTGTFALRAHGTSGTGSSINISSGHKYWIGLKYDNTANTSTVNVYDAESSNTLVGTSSVASSLSGTLVTTIFGGGYLQAAATGTTKYGAVMFVPSLTGWPMIAP